MSVAGGGWARTRPPRAAPGTRHRVGSALPVMSTSVITRVAVVPHPPLLVPELVPGSEQTTADVREAVMAAVRWLAAGSARWIAVGAHDGDHATFGIDVRGSFAGYGVDLPVSLSAEAKDVRAAEDLPLPVLMAGWLRQRAGAESVRVDLVSVLASPDECTARGRSLRDVDGDLGLLVLGDGSHRHGARAPGPPDERAEPFDATVAAALAAAEVAGLCTLDPAVACELGAVGRAPWQVLAGFAAGAKWHAELLYSGAPFGVGYHVATWEHA